jgi:signal transduction histidine kinase/CheY-like chemotaxis protein
MRPTPPPSRLPAYAVALLAVAAALVARQLLDPLFGDHLPFSTFMVAVVAVAWYGGLGPSVLTLLVGLLAADYFFIPPRYALPTSLLGHRVELLTILFVGLAMGLFSEAMHAARRKAEAQAREVLRQQHDLELEVARRKELADRLAEADRRKTEFLAMLSHELRNPLAPLHHAVQLLGGPGAEGPNSRKARDVIGRQVRQLTRLVEDLLDISRIASGKVRLRKEPVELAGVVERAVETSRPAIAARRHELIEGMPAGPLWVDADPVRLAQVVANLLNNAAKYTEERGHIRLTVGREGGEAVVRVGDDGIGIGPAELAGVFDLFAQGTAAADRSAGGLGVGLALVRTLVELHGGSVTAHSDGPGQGSEFVVRLPALEGPPVARGETGEQQAPVRPPACRILVVDDNQDGTEMLALLLRHEGHDVQTAADGPTALEVAGAFRPDMVLLDIGLPGMDGHAVARRLRQADAGKGMVLVAVTGYGQDEDRRRSRDAGFDHHLVKPVDIATLRDLLGGPQAKSPVRTLRPPGH